MTNPNNLLKISAKSQPSVAYEELLSENYLNSSIYNNARATVNDSEYKLKIKIEANAYDFSLDFIGIVYYFKRVK